MDNLQSNIFIAGKRLNDLTGYSGIEAMKKDIEEQGTPPSDASAQAYHTVSNTPRRGTCPRDPRLPPRLQSVLHGRNRATFRLAARSERAPATQARVERGRSRALYVAVPLGPRERAGRGGGAGGVGSRRTQCGGGGREAEQEYPGTVP